jgi:hypothetical protein
MKEVDIPTKLRGIVMMTRHPSVKILVVWWTDVSALIPGTSQKRGEGTHSFIMLVKER